MIVIDGDDYIIAYVERSLGIAVERPARAIGLMDDEKRPLCAAIFNDFNGSNIEVTLVAERMTRGALRYIAQYVFGTCGCRRLSARAKKRNKRSLRFMKRVGFTYEAVLKRYYQDDDAVLFRMFKEECAWL